MRAYGFNAFFGAAFVLEEEVDVFPQLFRNAVAAAAFFASGERAELNPVSALYAASYGLE